MGRADKAAWLALTKPWVIMVGACTSPPPNLNNLCISKLRGRKFTAPWRRVRLSHMSLEAIGTDQSSHGQTRREH